MFIHWFWNDSLQHRQQYYRLCGRLPWVETCWNKRVFAGCLRRCKSECFSKTNLVGFGTVGHESMAEEYPKNRKSQKIGKPKGHDGHDAVLQRLERRWSTRAELLQQKRSTIKWKAQMILHVDVRWCCMCKCAKGLKCWKIVEAFTEGLLKILTAPPTSFLRRMHRLRAEYVSLKLRHERCKHWKKKTRSRFSWAVVTSGLSVAWYPLFDSASRVETTLCLTHAEALH